jgi:serine/threonine-protein kinase RsbW
VTGGSPVRRLTTGVDPSETEQIRLTVPATAAAVRITRAGAAALAARAGFTYREVDEVRLAVGEATAMLTSDSAGDGRLAVTYAVEPDGLRVDLRLEDGGSGAGARLADLDAAVLDASVDAWRLDDDGRGLVLHKHLPEGDDEHDDD